MNDVYARLASAIVDMDEDAARALAGQAIDLGLPAAQIIERGLIAGMTRVSELYEAEEYFLTEVLLCADAMDAALEVVSPHMDKQ